MQSLIDDYTDEKTRIMRFYAYADTIRHNNDTGTANNPGSDGRISKLEYVKILEQLTPELNRAARLRKTLLYCQDATEHTKHFVSLEQYQLLVTGLLRVWIGAGRTFDDIEVHLKTAAKNPLISL